MISSDSESSDSSSVSSQETTEEAPRLLQGDPKGDPAGDVADLADLADPVDTSSSPLWALNVAQRNKIFTKLREMILEKYEELPPNNSAEFMHALGMVAKGEGVDIWTKDSKRGKTPIFDDSNCKWRAWQAFLHKGSKAASSPPESLPKKSKASKRAMKKAKIPKKASSPSSKTSKIQDSYKCPAYLKAAFEAYAAENGTQMPKKLRKIVHFLFRA